MTFKLFLPAVLTLIAVCGVMWLPASARAPENLPAIFLAIFVHVPVLLPVSQHGKLITSKSKVLNTYPEILLPPLLGVCWAFLGVTFGFSAGFVLAGAAAIAAICICYVAVRLCDRHTKHLQAQICHSDTLPTPYIADLSKRYLYLLRCAMAALSIAALMMHVAGLDVPYTWALLPGFTGAAAVFLAALTKRVDRANHAVFAKEISGLLSHQLQAAPASVAIYHAGTGRAHLNATKSLCAKLDDLGRAYVLIVREQAAYEELRKLDLRHLWRAEKLSALHHCAQPDLRTILYANDHPKNSHFTRYTRFEHVLVTEFSTLKTTEQLPKTTALYAQIIARGAAQAAQWRASAFGDIATRIVTNHSAFHGAPPRGEPQPEQAA
ncbi:hypothetical protein J7400_20650 [Shimia sp. R9_2]|uniref:hypothetical protein n=1 Tax=Shimia sp. R9_2 TaxID=2821112 RepID=UPI001ADC2645|nr:hypothetical protein [Shimia sp. R9_2]MBO9399092.1 hypothetical protein [Shimia sp. R9_2]